MVKDVLVCIARHVWSNPYNVRGEKYYYLDDGKSCVLSNVTCTSIKDLAKDMHTGLGISGPVFPQDNIIYKPFVEAETIYADGYFGRPLVPADVYRYEPLKRKQRKELEKHLKGLRKTINNEH